ncbi:MAG TPA: pilus assembly protein TadG-related protein, partial [Gemmatales bacterium]|nr:pilus assembly protein TadG-related protein [Gemmatales bacterium]
MITRTSKTPAAPPQNRSAFVIVLTALTLVMIFTFVALAIDLSMKALARNQCQNAADAAAIAGARSLTGDPATGYNLANVPNNSRSAAANNSVLGQPINPATQVTVEPGYYFYNQATSSFVASTDTGAPPMTITPAPPNTLVKADVTHDIPSFFSRVLGFNTLSTMATATAIHRPRDIVMIVDF